MDDDDNDAALAHQQELEGRRWQEEEMEEWAIRSMRSFQRMNSEWFFELNERIEAVEHGNHSIRHWR